MSPQTWGLYFSPFKYILGGELNVVPGYCKLCSCSLCLGKNQEGKRGEPFIKKNSFPLVWPPPCWSMESARSTVSSLPGTSWFCSAVSWSWFELTRRMTC